MFNISADLSQLVAARADLIASDDLSPANTRALNEIDGLLDHYDWKLVKAAEAAQAVGRAEKAEAA